MFYKSDIKFTDFSELVNSVRVFTNKEAFEEKSELHHRNIALQDPKKLLLDSDGRILYRLSNGEEVKIVLYVDYQHFQNNYYPHDTPIENLNRYHFYNCQNIEVIYRNGYRPSGTTREDGAFPYKFLGQFGEEFFATQHQQLLPCEKCLDIFNNQHRFMLIIKRN
jgi:hypothetical protein